MAMINSDGISCNFVVTAYESYRFVVLLIFIIMHFRGGRIKGVPRWMLEQLFEQLVFAGKLR